MTGKQEKACIGNIQSYLDRIHWLQSDGDPENGPEKECDLCIVFSPKSSFWESACPHCPLGPGCVGCVYDSGSTHIQSWEEASIAQLQDRMRWLLKRYKAADLEIEIT